MRAIRHVLKDALEVLATVAVIVAAVTVTWDIIVQRRVSIVQAAPSAPDAGAEDIAAKGLKLSLDRLVAGTPSSAKLALVEFADFECPFCGRYARETLPRLKSDFIDVGKVLYVFRQFPLEALHRNARYAAAAAVCAQRTGAFWETHGWLFANQRRLTRDSVQGHLATIGATEGCAEKADAEVARDLAEGERLGVNSTPTFFIGTVTSDQQVLIRTKIRGAFPFGVLSDEIVKLSNEH